MKRLFIPLAVLLIFSACNSGGSTNATDSAAAEDAQIVPATPAGTLTVTILDREKDTSKVQFNFTVDTLKYEKIFDDVPLMKGIPDSGLYRVFWDEPNSVWIGFIKPNRDTRYYHGSQDKASLRIRWVPSPPKKIYTFMEKHVGLGDAIRQQHKVQSYRKKITSGQIIEDFVVEIREETTSDDKFVHIEFGGIRRKLALPANQGIKPYVQVVAEDHCIVGLELPNGESGDYYEVKVVNGRIGYKQVQTALNIK